MNMIKIGIITQEEIRIRTLAIASGKYKPKADEPKIWFTSIRSLSEVLSDRNQALLQVIMDKKPHSIRDLSEMTGRQSSNLSRTLKMLASYGFVKLEKHEKNICPTVMATQFNVTFDIDGNHNHVLKKMMRKKAL